MKTKCVCLRNGYEHVLTLGSEYEVLDIQDGIFPGDYYVMVEGDNGKKATALLYRFDMSKEDAEAYVVEYHSDWRD